MDMNRIYILQNRKALNFLRWLWLSTNLFVTIRFQDIQNEVDLLGDSGGTVWFREGNHLIYKAINISKPNIVFDASKAKLTARWDRLVSRGKP